MRQVIAATISPDAKPCTSVVSSLVMMRVCLTSSRILFCTFSHCAGVIW